MYSTHMIPICLADALAGTTITDAFLAQPSV